MTETLERIARALGLEQAFKKHAHHLPRMGRVLAVGGIGFLIQTTIFEILGIWFGIVAPSTATLIGAECAIMSNFLLNERFSFKGPIHRVAPLYRRIIKFHLVSSGSLATQWTCLFIVEHISTSALALNGAFVIGVGIGFLINYTGYYFFVWGKN